MIDRRHFLAGVAAAGFFPASCRAAAAGVITPESFGARGDGRTNDTDAFAAMSAFVNAQGGGTIALRPVAYIVGKQEQAAPGSKVAFASAEIIHISGCRGPVVIRGNGATLRAAPGLRFGTFDRASGRATEHAMPFTKPGETASPYLAMIHVAKCSGTVDISDLEIDGNLQALHIGGKFGDKGWQIPGTGIRLTDNSGPERLARIYTHHHPLDGLYITGPADRASSSMISEVTAEYNGRQGCSITGGSNYAFDRCAFRHTGRAGLHSAPGAGVDIEPNARSAVRNVSFSGCEFSDNAGPGLLAPKGDAEGATFANCTFVGTTSWSAWPDKPGFRFSGCRFVGPIVHAYGDSDRSRAAQFRNCTFTDDPALAPGGRVYGGKNPGRPIADLPRSRNALFAQCRFQLVGSAVLPWSTNKVIYSDCEMSQRWPARSHPRGTYLGTSRIDGNADLSGSIIRGTVILNGRTLPRSG